MLLTLLLFCLDQQMLISRYLLIVLQNKDFVLVFKAPYIPHIKKESARKKSSKYQKDERLKLQKNHDC